MSRLSVYWPEDLDATSTTMEADEPVIIPFRGRDLSNNDGETVSYRISIPFLKGDHSHRDVISRARLLFTNRQCRRCDSPVVIPIDLNDGDVNGQGLEIPGTATIIGFRCHSCDARWSS